jgi:endonuclease YncB( thermonuclease family)
MLHQTLSEASEIDLYDHYKVGQHHVARVVVDGQDLSELLISQGLATLKGHGSKDWCTD